MHEIHPHPLEPSLPWLQRKAAEEEEQEDFIHSLNWIPQYIPIYLSSTFLTQSQSDKTPVQIYSLGVPKHLSVGLVQVH